MATPSQLLMEQINTRYEEDSTIAPDRMICLLTMIKKSNEKMPPGFISNVRFLLGESLKKKDQTIKFFGASASFLKKYGSKDDVQNLMTYVGSTGVVIQPSFVRQYLVTLAWHDINAAYLEFVEYTHTGLVRGKSPCDFSREAGHSPESSISGWGELSSHQKGISVMSGILLAAYKRHASRAQAAHSLSSKVGSASNGVYQLVSETLCCVSQSGGLLTPASVGCAILCFAVPLTSTYYSYEMNSEGIWTAIDALLGTHKMYNPKVSNYYGNMLIQVAGQVSQSPSTTWKMVRQLHRMGMLPETTESATGAAEGIGATSRACKIATSAICTRMAESKLSGRRKYKNDYQLKICTALDTGAPSNPFTPSTISEFLRAVAQQKPVPFGTLD